jgi:hypothetical protein
MPRTGWIKLDNDQRLPDHLSWGLLTRVFPPDVVEQVVADCGRLQQRNRLLPSRTVVYYVMGLALFAQSSYEEVMRMLAAGQSWASGWTQTPAIPTKAALFKARARLGPEPLQLLYGRVAQPMAEPVAGPGFYRSRRLMGIDGACLDVPNTPANEEAFGIPATSSTSRGLVQIRILGLTEIGTRTIVAATVGGIRERTEHLAREVLPAISPRMLVLAGAGFFSYSLWARAAASGADLLWQLSPNAVLPVERRHSDGSYASHVYANAAHRRAEKDGIEVRVLEVVDPGTEPGETDAEYRLCTTILDPAQAPAAELAAIYARRWQMDSAFDELKAHPRSPRVVLRSKVPDGVRQEAYGHLCVHFAIRWLMHRSEPV